MLNSNGSLVFRPPFKYQSGIQKAFEYWTIWCETTFDWLKTNKSSIKIPTVIIIQAIGCSTDKLRY